MGLTRYYKTTVFLHFISLSVNSDWPSDPSVGRRNEYQSKGSDAVRLGSKGRYGSWVGGR